MTIGGMLPASGAHTRFSSQPLTMNRSTGITFSGQKIDDFEPDINGDVDFFGKVMAGEIEGRRIILDNKRAAVLLDGYPLNRGHALIFPKRPISSFFSLHLTEVLDIFRLIKDYRTLLEETLTRKNLPLPDGYNLGVNIGKAGGQTRGRLHLHLIPRYDGDIDDPEGAKGGVRGLFMDADKKNYTGYPDSTTDQLFDD